MPAPRIFAVLLATAAATLAGPADAAPSKFNDSDPGVTLLVAKTRTTHSVLTKKGTKLAVMYYPGEQWYPQAEWLPAVQKDGQGTTGDRQTSVRQTGVRETRARTNGYEPNTALAIVVAGPGEQNVVKPVVDLLHTIGMDVVVFELNREDEAWALEAGEEPTDVVHAVVTWVDQARGSKIADEQITMFGIGSGADTALEVASRRQKLVTAVIADGASNTVVAATAKRLKSSKTRLLVLGADATTKAATNTLGAQATVALEPGQSLVAVMPGDHVTLQPNVLTSASYQTAVARFLLADAFIESWSTSGDAD